MNFFNVMGTSQENPSLFTDLLSLLLLFWLIRSTDVQCFICPIAVDEALCHPYLAPLHKINEEPVCHQTFVFNFEQPSFTEENIKELIWMESVKLNPDPLH